MNATSKFVIGAVATSLMAMASHSALGLGQSYVDSLTARATAEIKAQQASAPVMVRAVTEPALERVIILSGPSDAAERAKLIAAMKALPGVKDARWADDAQPAAAAAAPAAPATAAQVQNCQADVDAVIKGKTIQFDSGAASIRAESMPLIEALAQALSACAGTRVEIAGHTDATGDPAKNQTLSETRANAVTAELVNRGIPAGRLAPQGYGATKPRDPDTGAAANAANRRIEFLVASAAAPAAQ